MSEQNKDAGTAAAKQSFVHRNRFLWSGLLLVNVAFGGYLLLRTKKKTQDLDKAEVRSPVVIEEKTVAAETKHEALPSNLAVSSPKQIPEAEQRQLFNWILEERRKIKTSSQLEKSHIDEDKAVLKQFIRSKGIPSF